MLSPLCACWSANAILRDGMLATPGEMLPEGFLLHEPGKGRAIKMHRSPGRSGLGLSVSSLIQCADVSHVLQVKFAAAPADLWQALGTDMRLYLLFKTTAGEFLVAVLVVCVLRHFLCETGVEVQLHSGVAGAFKALLKWT